MTFLELKAVCDAPKDEQPSLICKITPAVERVIAEGIMRAKLENNIWVISDSSAFPKNLGLWENDGEYHTSYDFYRPLQRSGQALAAMDKMIARDWAFKPSWNGPDFSMVEAFHYGLRLHVRACYFSDAPERHATALSLAVAQTWLLERDLPEILAKASRQEI